MNQIKLNISGGHKTTKNIKRTGAFTVSIADSTHVIESDYFGITSGNTTKDKFEKSGMHAVKSENVVDVSVDENYLDADGKVNVEAIKAIAYDSFNHDYYEIGKKVGKAFSDGKKLI